MKPRRRQGTTTRLRCALAAVCMASGVFAQCKLAQRVKQPAERLIKQGSCIAIALPPITLTPERTAAERQLIGEDRELEKNGWLIASARSTAAPGGRALALDPKTAAGIRRLYQEIGVVEFYGDLVREYQAGLVLGRGRDGRLYVVPNQGLRKDRFRNPEEVRRASVIAGEVNRARDWIQAYFAEADHPPLEAGKKVTDTFQVRIGEFYQDAAGRWVRKE